VITILPVFVSGSQKYATLIKAIFGDIKKKITPIWNVLLAVKQSNYSYK
jgi:hypothetical protein